MAFAMCLRLTFLWLALLVFKSQSDDSIINHGSNGSSIQSSTVITNGSPGDNSIHSLVSMSTVEGLAPGQHTAHVPSTPSSLINVYSMPSSIPTDLAVSSVSAQSHFLLGLRHSPGTRRFSHRSHREHLVPRAKCPKSPLPRKIGYYQV